MGDAFHIRYDWFRVQCYNWPNCRRGDGCTYLHGAQDHRPGVDLQRARGRGENPSLATGSLKVSKHLLECPEPPAVDAAASEALLRWLYDRAYASRQVSWALPS
jgi:hypothetical protein